MWDRYDPRSSDARDRDKFGDRDRGGRGAAAKRGHGGDRRFRDLFANYVDLPRARERRPVRERDHVYEIDGTESRMLATVGAFRVVSESDLHDAREDSRRAQRHLEHEGLKTFKKAWVVAVLKAHGVDPRWRNGAYKDLSTECQHSNGSGASTCTGTIFGTSTRRGWSSAASRWPRCVICSGTRRFSRPSATTTRSWRHCRQPPNGWKEARRSNPKMEATDNLSAEAVSRDSAKVEVSRIFQVPAEQRFAGRDDPADENRRSH